MRQINAWTATFAVALAVMSVVKCGLARAADFGPRQTVSQVNYGPPPAMYTSGMDASCEQNPAFCSTCRAGWHETCWNHSCLYRRITEHHREKQSYHMYIRGYGPAIHERPVGRSW